MNSDGDAPCRLEIMAGDRAVTVRKNRLHGVLTTHFEAFTLLPGDGARIVVLVEGDHFSVELASEDVTKQLVAERRTGVTGRRFPR